MGMAYQDIIPLHRLDEHTDEGYQIDRMDYVNKQIEDAVLLGTHRDDHYIFLMQETGRSSFMVDFSQFTMEGNMIFYLLPGQVHSYLDALRETSGWFLALDTRLVPDIFRAVLEDPLMTRRPLPVTTETWAPVTQCLRLLHTINRGEPSTYNRQAAYGLINSFVALFTALHARLPDMTPGTMTRPAMITQSFKRRLLEQYKDNKSPIEYANALNISLSYLNEVVKATTGLSVSRLIQQEVMLEAKRLLYHSDCSIKEVAHALGYDDHTYFSRLFRKAVGTTPGEFRRQYRE